MNPYLIATAVIAVFALSTGKPRRTLTTIARKLLPMSTLDLIKKHEGWRPNVYPDAAGHPTIGWGHKLLPGETFKTITEAQGEALLRQDMARIEKEIRPAITRDLSDNQRAAVVSFAFNVGANAFKSSTLLKKINAGDTQGAAAEFMRWNKARKNGELVPVLGLTRRRQDEKTLFLT